jgi:nanoRNase/pAp phosphatase (c-di-AMP/oligoRNAs hydrolase)
MLKYGGGHKVVGTCQVPYEKADTVLKELVSTIKKNG